MARKTPVEESIERLAEEKIYEKVYEEVASGVRREGIWFKALSESGGDETKAKALYVKLRVRSLTDELIVTEKIHQDAYKAEQAQYKEATRVNQELANSKKRAVQELANSKKRNTEELASSKKRAASRKQANELFMGLVILLRACATLAFGVTSFGLMFSSDGPVFGALSGQDTLIFITMIVVLFFLAYVVWPKNWGNLD